MPRRRVMVGGGRSVAGSAPVVPTLAAHDPAWTPAQGDIANGNPITLGVHFIAVASTDLGGVAFFAPATVAGTYTAAVWQSTAVNAGNLLGQASVMAAEITPGAWNYVDVPVTVGPDLVFAAGVWTSTGRYVRTAPPGAGLPFNGAAITGHGITLLADGTDPNPPGLGSMRNGVFANDPGGAGIAYPTGTFESADYGIDVWL